MSVFSPKYNEKVERAVTKPTKKGWRKRHPTNVVHFSPRTSENMVWLVVGAPVEWQNSQAI